MAGGSLSNSLNFAQDWGATDDKVSAGETDSFITKINSDGSYGWTHTLGGDSWEESFAVCADGRGSVFLTGKYESATANFAADWGGTDIKTCAGMRNFFITRIGTDGAYYWTHRAGGTGRDESVTVCTDLHGNIYMAGWFRSSTVDFGADWGISDEKTSAGQEDAYITKIRKQ